MEASRKLEEEARLKAQEDALRRSLEQEELARLRRKELEEKEEEEISKKRQSELDALELELAKRKIKDLEDQEAERVRKRRQELEERESLARRRAAAEDAAVREKEALLLGMLQGQARQFATDKVSQWLGSSLDARCRQSEEEERRRRIAAGKRTFLRKGEGTKAADQAGRFALEKEIEEKAKRDIAYYSLNHARKEGLVNEKHPTLIRKEEVPLMEFKDLDASLDRRWNNQWTPEEEERFARVVTNDLNSNVIK